MVTLRSAGLAPQDNPLLDAGNIQPLTAAAPSGGLGPRPGRLVYPDGTLVEVRLFGGNGPAMDATAAGVVPGPVLDPAGGGRAGWLQVVRIRGIGLTAAHPALVSPKGTSPYDGLTTRQKERFAAFDTAEADYHGAAMLPARLLDPGDRLPAAPGLPPGSTVTATRASRPGIITITVTGRGGLTSAREFAAGEMLTATLPARHPAQHGPRGSALFAAAPAASPRHAPPAAAHRTQLAGLSFRLDVLLRTRLAGPGDAGPAPGWGQAAADARQLQRAQAAAGRTAGPLRNDPAWQQLRAVTRRAARLAAGVRQGRIRFASPGWALRAWREIWARAGEITGDLAAAAMTRLRPGSRGWRAASRVHHAAAEAVAHARGWLPRGRRLPPGSYTPPRGYTAPTAVAADAATRLHDRGAGPLISLDFPGPLTGVPARTNPRGRSRPASRPPTPASAPAPARR